MNKPTENPSLINLQFAICMYYVYNRLCDISVYGYNLTGTKPQCDPTTDIITGAKFCKACFLPEKILQARHKFTIATYLPIHFYSCVGYTDATYFLQDRSFSQNSKNLHLVKASCFTVIILWGDDSRFDPAKIDKIDTFISITWPHVYQSLYYYYLNI